ncbi:Modulator of FtsH protease HflC [Planctomycetes bacterium Poly30]|uniref:Modulator of FtsH protease HflC n=1 Tax=Saltatorellus ferox TaxID=2528018 RepID=A0A518ERH0_9BACT|nr:Modulator of FtsH protease HflC [Planctomycetes bacterium Poly30]
MTTEPKTVPSREAAVGGGSSRNGFARTTGLWLVGALVVLALYLGSFTVRAGEVAIVARFGDPRRLVEEPGLHFKWPAPVDSLFRIDMRTNVLDPGIEEFLTDDQKNVDVDSFVAWKVADPRQFLKSLRDRQSAEEKIGQVLQSALLEILNSGPFDDLVQLDPDHERNLAEVREDVTRSVRQRCRDNGYGVEILMAGIERINFPYDNRSAVEAAMRTTRDKEAREIAAGGQEIAGAIMATAKTEAERIKTNAQSDATTIFGKAIAEAGAIKVKSRALNPELFDIVGRHETALLAMRGTNLVFGSDHWLMRVFEDPARRSLPGVAEESPESPTPAETGGESDQ